MHLLSVGSDGQSLGPSSFFQCAALLAEGARCVTPARREGQGGRERRGEERRERVDGGRAWYGGRGLDGEERAAAHRAAGRWSAGAATHSSAPATTLPSTPHPSHRLPIPPWRCPPWRCPVHWTASWCCQMWVSHPRRAPCPPPPRTSSNRSTLPSLLLHNHQHSLSSRAPAHTPVRQPTPAMGDSGRTCRRERKKRGGGCHEVRAPKMLAHQPPLASYPPPL